MECFVKLPTKKAACEVFGELPLDALSGLPSRAG
jgi:hypothetical protein